MIRSTLARRLLAGALLSALAAGPALASGQAVTVYDQRDNPLGTATNPLVTGPAASAPPQPVTSPDAVSTGTIAAGTVGSAFAVPVNDRGTVRFTVSGLTGTGATLQSQFTGADGTTWEPVAALRPPLAYGTTITADGQYEVKASGASAVRLIVTVAGSAGTVTASALASQTQGLVGLVGSLPPGTNTIGNVVQGAAGTAPWLVAWSGQSVAVSSLPSLPAGANVIGAVTQSGGPWSVSGTVSAAQSGAWTVTQGPAGSSAWKVDGSGVTQPISAAALPLAAGAATAAGQSSTAAGTSAATAQGVQGVVGGVPAPVMLSSSLPAGSALIGKVGIDQTTPGTTNGVIVNGGNLNSNIFAAYSASLVTANPGGNQPQLDVRGQIKTSETGSSDPLVGIVPVVTQSGTALVGKGSAGNLYGAYALNTTTTAAFLVVVNLAAAPASGTAITPQECVPLPASGSAAVNYGAGPPDAYTAGIVLLVSTSCATYTPSTLSAFIKSRVR